MTTAADQATPGLMLPIPADAIDAIAEKVAEILAGRIEGPESPWMDRPAAAAYLSVPLSRLEKDKTIPSHRWDGRVLYHRGELDEFLLGLEAA